MADCIFCRIALGEIPSARVFDGPLVSAFLDISPVAHGHVLVIPKRHCATVIDMTDDEMAALAGAVRRLAPAVMEAVGAEGLNVLNNLGSVAGQSVGHVHFHLIPRTDGDGLGYRWQTTRYPDGRMNELASDISARLMGSQT